MLIFIGLAVLLVIGVVMAKTSDEYSGFNLAGILLTICSGIFLIVTLTFWPIHYYGMKDQINQYDVTKQDIANSRGKNLSEVERAALTNKIIELNRELASAKYWNQTALDIFIPDEVMDLEYLK